MNGFDEFERRIVDFENAWRDQGSPTLRAFLPDEEDGTAEFRRRVLQELICIDLEFRWRLGMAPGTPARPPLLEDYVQQFPELLPLDDLPVSLLAEEYRVRYRWGDRPGHAAFVNRFGGRANEILAALRQLDLEFATEREPGRRERAVSTGARRQPPSMRQAMPDPEAPLSHTDFVLQKLIGAGGAGKVYRAWQRSLGRPVAIKHLRKEWCKQTDVVERFLDEARTIARLRHPAIVNVHGIGRSPGGGYFIAMDWIEGGDLAALVRTGPVASAEAVRLIIEACGAISVAHQQRIVHCDLKPGNVLRDTGGRVWVTDFGLARNLDGNQGYVPGIEGTAVFMAPEQVCDAWGPISERTDVYGLGAVLYTLLTARAPWDGTTFADILAQVASGKPVPEPQSKQPTLEAWLNDVCLRCLAKTPAFRFGSVLDLAEALAAGPQFTE